MLALKTLARRSANARLMNTFARPAARTSGGSLGEPVLVERKEHVRVPYTGPLQAAILDWSGTVADAHVIAPAVVFFEVFKKHGVEISMTEARVPMGLRKDLHIAQILDMPEVKARWTKIKGAAPTQQDVDDIFADFVPMQLAVIPKYSTMLPGAVDACRIMQKEQNLLLGSTTGFTRAMVDVLLENTAEEGYKPDFTVGGDEVENGMGFRPTPFLIYKNLVNLKVWPIESVVKVDDTVTGVGEGVTAGCWTVGVAGVSNYTNVDTIGEWEAMSEAQRAERVEKSREMLYESGAHYVTDSIREMPWIVEDINKRLASIHMGLLSS